MTRPELPRPPSRPDNAGILARLRLFRADMFRSQPERLYRAWMARMRSPLGQSVLVNDPELVREVLDKRPMAFPKARGIGAALRPLLGNAVFVTNGAQWQAQRRLIDPAFAAGRLKESFPAMAAAIKDGVQRLEGGRREVEFEMSHMAADIIFRTLFSMPLDAPRAREVFEAFRDYQRSQPLLSPGALFPLPRSIAPVPGRAEARRLRQMLGALVAERRAAIARGDAPDDLSTRIMTTADPETGAQFSETEMVDQVAIFFLAGHETSASALSWALYCLSLDPQAQDEVCAEAEALGTDGPSFSDLSALPFTRDVFREALRLFPPVPMMVRQSTRPEVFRKTRLRKGALVILSPWHMHRHDRLWPNPDRFDPWRWQSDDTRALARQAYIPFSRGPRVCSGAGFAMMEGTLALALLIKAFRFKPTEHVPVPVAHLTVRAQDGIVLELERRTET